MLVSAGSALTMVIVFLIPSLQDQWDRYQSRQVIQEYARLGDSFFDDERYDMAEQAYAKAFELSENQRLDIEIKRLNAKVSRIGLESEWGAAPPEDLEDVDFQFLLQFQRGKEFKSQRTYTLNSYGIFLAAKKKLPESAAAFKEALALDSANVLVLINYGNLLDEEGEKKEAEYYYKKALVIAPDNSQVHYNLGLLYREQGRPDQARAQFAQVVKLEPRNEEAAQALKDLNR